MDEMISLYNHYVIADPSTLQNIYTIYLKAIFHSHLRPLHPVCFGELTPGTEENGLEKRNLQFHYSSHSF